MRGEGIREGEDRGRDEKGGKKGKGEVKIRERRRGEEKKGKEMKIEKSRKKERKQILYMMAIKGFGRESRTSRGGRHRMEFNTI